MSDNLPFCAECSTLLEPRYSRGLLIWVHSRVSYGTHPARMVPLFAVDHPILFCTFCGSPNPHTVHLASPVDGQTSEEAMRWEDRGVWFTCKRCDGSLRRGDIATLVTRTMLAAGDTLNRKDSKDIVTQRVGEAVTRVVRSLRTDEWLREWWVAVPVLM